MHQHVVPGCLSYNRFSRRRVLQAAVAGASAGWLTGLAEGLARASEKTAKPKSLLMIWLQGGPSQLETFDPHPGTKIGGDVQSISTSVKDLRIADCMPFTAEQMHHATLVRSVVSREGDHERATYHLKTGWRPDPTLIHPSVGAVVCYQGERNLEIPRHISILPGNFPARGGYLGPALDAFQIGDPGEPIPNLKSRVSEERFAKRLGPLLGKLEEEFQRGRFTSLDERRTLHQTGTREAVSMMNSEQLTAFDVKQEGFETLQRFGDNGFGRGCLAAVRLLSTGVRCVEVELDGWDTHANNHSLQVSKASRLDAALGATLAELKKRDLLDDTIVVCGGEFGRTPRINVAAGRDHWPHGFSMLLAGGRFRRGYVHGKTNSKPTDDELKSQGGKVDLTKLVENPVSVPDLHATILKALDVDYEDEQMTPIGRPLKWSDGKAVEDLLS